MGFIFDSWAHIKFLKDHRFLTEETETVIFMRQLLMSSIPGATPSLMEIICTILQEYLKIFPFSHVFNFDI